MAKVDMKMKPGGEDEVQRMIVAKANEAMAAIGPTGGNSADEIEAALTHELAARGLDLGAGVVRTAAEAIAGGRPFEFR